MSLVQPTRILVVGAGGREHALAWKLGAEPGVNEIVVVPGSDAIAGEPRVRVVDGVDPLDPEAVVEVARARSVELAVIGPEAPLAAGVADALEDAGVATFGPSAAAARIESSKSFCHEVADAAGVTMARASVAEHVDQAKLLAAAEAARGGGLVVKSDGLAAGKGVVVADDEREAMAAIDRLAAAGANRFVIEERLAGPEASVIGICDGRDLVALPAARDHKRLLDGDAGPNTGGMGAFAPLPELDSRAIERILDTVHRPILAELARRGTPFRGFLYAGLMLTADGPRLLECNARLGDPEAQVILPLLAAPLGPTLLAAARGRLGAATAGWPDRVAVPTLPGAAAGIVLAAAGYPETSRTGDEIEGLREADDLGAIVFHAASRRSRSGRWTTSGGRVLTVVGRGDDLGHARERAEAAVAVISWSGMQRRHDIGAALPVAGGVA
jgi:phosphoribosylamine--glycine ligase